MVDDLKRRAPEDTRRINVSQPWELSGWAKALGTTEDRIRQAVAAVGVMVADVREWLREN